MWDILWAPTPQGEQNLKIQHMGGLGSLMYRTALTGILSSRSLQVYENSGFGMFLQLADAAMECWQKEKPGGLEPSVTAQP